MKKMFKKMVLALVVMLVATTVATVPGSQGVQAATKKTVKKPTVIRFNCTSGAYATIAYGGTTWSKGTTLKPGRTYTVKCSFRNYCGKEIHKAISGLHGQAWVPGTIKKGQTASMFLGFTAKNADNKQYSLALKANENLKLSYVPGSAKFTNNGNVRGRKLSTNLFKWGTGVELSKSVPGNKKCSGYFTFKIKVSKVAKTSNSSPSTSKKPSSKKKPKKSDW